jgi:hypothetical protein
MYFNVRTQEKTYSYIVCDMGFKDKTYELNLLVVFNCNLNVLKFLVVFSCSLDGLI